MNIIMDHKSLFDLLVEINKLKNTAERHDKLLKEAERVRNRQEEKRKATMALDGEKATAQNVGAGG